MTPLTTDDCETLRCLLAQLGDSMQRTSPWEIAGPAIALFSVVVSSVLVIVMAHRESKQKARDAVTAEQRRVDELLQTRRRRVIDAWMTAVSEVQHVVANWGDSDNPTADSNATLRYIAAAVGASKLDEVGREVGLGTLVHAQVYSAAIEVASSDEANGFLEHARRILRYWSEGDFDRLREEYGPWPIERVDRLTPPADIVRKLAEIDEQRRESPDPLPGR